MATAFEQVKAVHRWGMAAWVYRWRDQSWELYRRMEPPERASRRTTPGRSEGTGAGRHKGAGEQRSAPPPATALPDLTRSAWSYPIGLVLPDRPSGLTRSAVACRGLAHVHVLPRPFVKLVRKVYCSACPAVCRVCARFDIY